MVNIKPKIIGIAGGSGSGKTTFAEQLCGKLGPGLSRVLLQDNYYIDQSSRFKEDGDINFDHPLAIDFPLLSKHLIELKRGSSVRVPIYDFATHKRKTEVIDFAPVPFVVVDGILLFHSDELFAEFDFTVFIDTQESIRFDRRLKRDIEERGRKEEGVRKQFAMHVKPMHDLFVQPSKVKASRVYSGETDFGQALDEVMKWVQKGN